MEPNPFWEADISSASHKIYRIFMQPEGSLLHSEGPATCLSHETNQSSPCPIPRIKFPF
jgi:hypothetical protein